MIGLQETFATVQQYFEDERILLEDWYRDLYRAQFPGEPVAAMPSLEKIQSDFKKWVEDSKIQLRNLICVEWDYPKRRDNKEFQDKVGLAAGLADFLISLTLEIPAPIATATLLVQMGLDRICDRYLEGES